MTSTDKIRELLAAEERGLPWIENVVKMRKKVIPALCDVADALRQILEHGKAWQSKWPHAEKALAALDAALGGDDA